MVVILIQAAVELAAGMIEPERWRLPDRRTRRDLARRELGYRQRIIVVGGEVEPLRTIIDIVAGAVGIGFGADTVACQIVQPGGNDVPTENESHVALLLLRRVEQSQRIRR